MTARRAARIGALRPGRLAPVNGPRVTGRFLPKLAAGVCALAAFFGGTSGAHQAPGGWHYDLECCHVMDCAPVPDGTVIIPRAASQAARSVVIMP